VSTPEARQASTIYTFWETAGGGAPPAYVELCMQTWRKAMPRADIVCLSHRTVGDLSGDLLDLESLRRFPLATQSDAIAVAVLFRHGGLFLDADTIVTRPFLDDFRSGDTNRLTLFGEPGKPSAHVAFMHCPSPGNPLLAAWLREIQRRIARYGGWRRLASRVAGRFDPRRVRWDYLSNGILDPLLASGRFDAATRILDRKAHGFILEAACLDSGDPMTDYRKFYFSNWIGPEQALPLNSCGVIALHNSWTPRAYREASRESVLAADNLLSAMLRSVLAGR
jgi:Capsular polysaccharide synthesis protein